MSRFRGTLLAGALLMSILFVWWSVDGGPPQAQVSAPTPLMRFDEADVRGFVVQRPAQRLELQMQQGVWRTVDHSWRPRSAMIRRMAHQLHALDASSRVDDRSTDLDVYGLGPEATEVTVRLADGGEQRLRVGITNPTRIRHYVQRPGGAVFTVKKAAVEAFFEPMEAYREDEIARLEIDDVTRVQATIQGRILDVRREGPRDWRLVAPVVQDAGHDAVQMLIGRVSALRARQFVADDPVDPERWGLGDGADRIVITFASGRALALRIGAPAPGSDPPLRYVLHEGDHAVYAVPDGFLETFRLPPEALRDREIVGRHGWEVRGLEVVDRTSRQVRLSHTDDGWRWADGAAVTGSTPTRLAERIAGLEATGFPDPEAAPDQGRPDVTITLRFDDGATSRVEVFRPENVRPEPPSPTLARTGPGGAVFEIDGSIMEVVDDLLVEYDERQERDAVRHLDEAHRVH